MASLNLHCGFGFFGHSFDVAAALCELEADVICVQESWLLVPAAGGTPDPLAEAAGKLGATVHRAALRTLDSLSLSGVPPGPGPGELAIGVLTSLPVADYEVIELGGAPGDEVPRRAQVVTLKLAGGSCVRIVNTHLTHRLTSPLQLRRLQQRLRADAQVAGQIPTVIVGDLNMPRSLATMSLQYSATVRGRTWPDTRPLIQLDHILVDRSLKVIESAIMPAAGSDHLPIRARLGVIPAR